MKIAFLWFFYPEYLRYFDRRHPECEKLPFAQHRERLLDDHYTWSGELSRHMAAQGWGVEYFVGNAVGLQDKWAREKGLQTRAAGRWNPEIALAQLREFQPDILWLSSYFECFGTFARDALKHARKIVTWVGEPWPAPPDLEGISVLITENPDTFKASQGRFERVIVTTPGFSKAILDDLGPTDKQYDVTFSGQVSPVHQKRASLLAHLLRSGIRVNVQCMMDEDRLPSGPAGLREAAWHLLRGRSGRRAREALRRTFRPTNYERDTDLIGRANRGAVFGLEMYRSLASSRLVLNAHADIAGAHAGNMRLFEATGLGACLLTEDSPNIAQLFTPGQEVLTYRSKDELLESVRQALQNPTKTERIAAAGRQRTLTRHTLERFCHDIRPALEI